MKYRSGRHKLKRRATRGAALVIALALILALTMLVVATQIQVVSQLKVSKTERDYERALQMAEAGANAYLNVLANGSANSNLLPPINALDADLSPAQFKQQALSGAIPSALLIHYPAGAHQGYYVGHLGTVGATVTVISYGWSNDVVRRVEVTASALNLFDWAGLYGLSPGTGANDYCLEFSGGANVVGACGGEGILVNVGSATFYNGPIIDANATYQAPYGNVDPAVVPAASNVPPGYGGTGALASPLYRHYLRKLNVPTADQAANLRTNGNLGVEAYRNQNNNATGLRLLVQNASTGAIRELRGNDSVLPISGSQQYTLTFPNQGAYHAVGMTAGEVPYGIRVYPGDYFFEQVNLAAGLVLSLRTFNDADQPDEPPNPNPGQSANHNIRFWIGHSLSGDDIGSTFACQTRMEDTVYASRFHIYVANHGPVSLVGAGGNGGVSPAFFQVDLLAYNRDANGAYGQVQLTNNVYVIGSLFGWQIDVNGSTVQREATEPGSGDPLAFVVTNWTELQSTTP